MVEKRHFRDTVFDNIKGLCLSDTPPELLCLLT